MRQIIWLSLVCACTNAPGGSDPDLNGSIPKEQDARFVGLWAVTQPYHALYEQTLYWFHADGELVTAASNPADCSGHLSEHCVTGSVGNCVREPGTVTCGATVTCVFGQRWGSVGASTLVIAGECSDGTPRPIMLAFNLDSSMNTDFGANATLVSVASDPNWSHDNWDWAFQKCPDGVEATCPSTSPL